MHLSKLLIPLKLRFDTMKNTINFNYDTFQCVLLIIWCLELLEFITN